MSTLAVLFLLMDGVMKLVKPAFVVQATVQLGYPESVMIGLGIVLLACTILYMIPLTNVLGAILLTGYLGGAVATHVRIGSPLPSHTLVPSKAFKLTRGSPRYYTTPNVSGGTRTRGFCADCGSRLLGAVDPASSFIGIVLRVWMTRARFVRNSISSLRTRSPGIKWTRHCRSLSSTLLSTAPNKSPYRPPGLLMRREPHRRNPL